jgi:hypothetical protein
MGFTNEFQFLGLEELFKLLALGCCVHCIFNG